MHTHTTNVVLPSAHLLRMMTVKKPANSTSVPRSIWYVLADLQGID